jgi:hypothetical protein
VRRGGAPIQLPAKGSGGVWSGRGSRARRKGSRARAVQPETEAHSHINKAEGRRNMTNKEVMECICIIWTRQSTVYLGKISSLKYVQVKGQYLKCWSTYSLVCKYFFKGKKLSSKYVKGTCQK